MSDLPVVQFPEFISGSLSWEDFIKKISLISSIKSAYPLLTPNKFADMFALLEAKDIRVAEVYLNPMSYSDVRKWGRDVLDVETRKECLQLGIMSMVWGASIIVSTKIPNNTVLFLSEKEQNSGVLLQYKDASIPESKELLRCYEELTRMSSELQSVLRKASESIYNMMDVIESMEKNYKIKTI